MDLSSILTEKNFQKWIQKEYRTKTKEEELKRKFQSNTPFPHLELNNFFNEERILEVFKAVTKEQFSEKESDLFKFMQTGDLNVSQQREIQEFQEFLSSQAFVSFLEVITGIKLKVGSIDLFGSMYQNTDYLLPHDDQLEGRKVAFLLYLSNLEVRDGGKLILYKTKGSIPREEEKAIIPKFNTFVIFKVSEKSFHEVEEVLTNTQRIALGGWFHGTHTQSIVSQKGQY